MHNIRQTLLECLFGKAAPFMGAELREYESDVFPGKADFQQFLKETDTQKRVVLAKRILLRLGSESKLLLPHQMVQNLLRVEEKLGEKPSTYIPRDHYVHLVNLYLLGVYIYCYHKNLHHIVTRFFKKLRRQPMAAQLNLSNEVAFLDFVFAWRAFVLLHDLGYIWECDLTTQKDLLSSARSYWHKIPQAMADEMALQYLARITAWRFADKEHEGINLEEAGINKVFKFQGKSGGEEFPFMGKMPAAWQPSKEYTRQPLIHGTRFLSTVRTLAEEKRTVALLVQTRYGEIKCGIFPTLNEQHEVKKVGRFDVNSERTLIKMAFTEGKTPRSGSAHEMEWHYFYPNYTKLQEGFHGILAKHASHECRPIKMTEVSDQLLRDTVVPNMTVFSEGDYRRVEFLLYESLTEWRARVSHPTTGEIKADVSVAYEIVGEEEKRLGGKLGDFIKKRIETVCQKIRIPEQLESPTDRAVSVTDDILRYFGDLEGLRDEFIEWYMANVVGATQTDNQRKKTYLALATFIGKNLLERNYLGGTERLTGEDLQTVDGVRQRVDAILKGMKAPGMVELLEKYHPPFLGRPDTMDHGLAAAVGTMRLQAGLTTVVACMEKQQQSVEDELGNVMGKTCRLSQSLGEKSQLEKTKYHIEVLLDQVTAAIALHNIYPKYLEGYETMKINTVDAPFCYFAMLCDSLQKWDREPRLALADRKLPYKTVSDSYDISIEGDLIRVSEFDYPSDNAARRSYIRDGLEEYLHGAKDLIAIEFGEWKH